MFDSKFVMPKEAKNGKAAKFKRVVYSQLSLITLYKKCGNQG
ncbi:Uncharacterised protein [Campylobacter geochelonis]|uniref:Uncharacterized protein n=1 Tax=Campylobacter geochelonis TaxID=1780362 RepID=A0A128ECU3_9BACT|nr:Uncharacterised protein [Campylobacter geochelonis]